MIGIAETVSPDSVILELEATSGPEAIRETALLLRGQLAVLDWEQLHTELYRSAPCLSETDGTFCLSFPHARTDAVDTMVMSVGVSPEGIAFSGCGLPVRYIFCIGVPKAMASDYLRIVGLLVRILREPGSEAYLRSSASGAEFVERLAELESKL